MNHQSPNQKVKKRLDKNPDLKAIIEYVEEMCGLTTGDDRDARKNCNDLSSLTEYSSQTMYTALYLTYGRLGSKCIIKLVEVTLTNGLTAAERQKAQGLKWSSLLSWYKQEHCTYMLHEIAKMVAAASERSKAV